MNNTVNVFSRIVICIIFLMLAVCGCTANIPISDSSGMSKVMSSEEVFSKDLISDHKTDSLEEDKSIFLDHNNGTVELKVDATYDFGKKASLLTGKLIPIVLNQELVINKFAYEGVEAIQKNDNDLTDIILDTKDGYSQHIRMSSYGFKFIDNKLMKGSYNKKEELIGIVKTNSLEEESKKVFDIITDITKQNISIRSVRTYKSSYTNELFYEIVFSQEIDGIPFETTNISSRNVVKAIGSAVIGNEGIGEITYNTFFVLQNATVINKYIHIDDAMELLKSYVEKYYIFADYIFINKIEINYIAKISNINEIVLYPAWVFTIDKDESKAEYPLNGSIVINAVTGQIEFLD